MKILEILVFSNAMAWALFFSAIRLRNMNPTGVEV